MLWTAFILGLVGSLHCAGMCGPLALAVPVVHQRRIASRLLYNSGRIAAYAALGALSGLAGEAFRLADAQQWLSIGLGVLLLAGLAFSWNKPIAGWMLRLKSTFGTLLHRRSFPALFALGATNGLLPCGLVYVAAAAASSTGHLTTGIASMIAFGLGTAPMMIALPLLGGRLAPRFNFQKLIPVSIMAMAALLILRGLALGIPYLSPNLDGACPACH
jgi:uncharacterized protein